jgi:hypothetical protein
MADRVRLEMRAGPEFNRVATALRSIDRKLPTKLRKDIRDKVKPLVRQAKFKVINLPVEGDSGSTGLRRRVARGVSVRVGVGVKSYVRVVTRMSDPHQAIIPRGLDDPTRGWKHPTFGHAPEVRQHAAGHWFVDTFASGKDEIRDGIHHVLEDAADYVAANGGPRIHL